jgi:hypothetical protein
MTKMDRIKPWARSLIFLVLLAVILKGCSFLFAQTGYVRFILNKAESKETSYDTIILGASHCRGAIDPEKLNETLGTNAINMAIPGETIEDSYFVLKDIDDSNDVKTVILDIDFQYWMYEQPTKHFTKSFIYQQLKNPIVKAEYVVKNRKVLDMRNFVTNRLSWNISPSTVKKNLKLKNSDVYKNNEIEAAYGENGRVEGADGPYVGKGFFYRQISSENPLPEGHDYLMTWVGRSDDALDENVKAIFKEIVKYCNDKNYRLICVTSPINPTSVETLKMEYAHDSLTAFITGECGVEYYDFNNALMSFIPRSDCDYGDQEGHMGGELAEIYSEKLAEFLADAWDGDYDSKKYFYSTFEDMYKNMKTDYTSVTGKEWRSEQ